MALQKREKTLLKVLAGIAVISAVILYRTFAKSSDPVVETTEVTDTEKKADEKKAPVSTSRGGGGGGSRGGGGKSAPAPSISSSDFQRHSTPNDCWVLVEGKVYDITSIFKDYPNQTDSMSSYCGTFGFEAGFLSDNQSFSDTIKSQGTSKGTIN